MDITLSRRILAAAALAVAVAIAAACSSDTTGAPSPAVSGPDRTDMSGDRAEGAGGAEGAGNTDAQRFPDVLEARLIPASGGTFNVEVTMSSPYDTPQRYADGWRVLTADGTELGSHTLLHDHANEQPFTRVQSGLQIPPNVDTVVVEGRDQANGYGGNTVKVAVPGR